MKAIRKKPIFSIFVAITVFLFSNIYASPSNAASIYVEVGAGYLHSCALNSSGEVYCWGNNEVGQLGIGKNSEVELIPQKVPGLNSVTSLSVGFGHNCAITGKMIYCWGQNGNGKLGNGSDQPETKPTLVKGLNNAVSIFAGRVNTCAIDASFNAYCWGDNKTGILGNGSKELSVTPVQVKNLSNVKQIVSGSNHSCAITNDGSTYCWGDNTNGQLGLIGVTESLVPMLVSTLPKAQSITAGSGHSCILTQENKIFCWGYGEQGQIGNGKNEIASTPSEVNLTSQAKSIQAGRFHTCAYISTKQIYCWGSGESGQLGNGSTTNVNIPNLVKSDTKFKKLGTLSTISSHTCALTESNNLSCWGLGDSGQLGQGKKETISVPTTYGQVEQKKATSDVDLSTVIKCKKGNLTKEIKGISPKCPSGYQDIKKSKPKSVFYLELKNGCYAQNFPATEQVVMENDQYKTWFPTKCTERHHIEVIYSGKVPSTTGTGLPTQSEVSNFCSQKYVIATGQPAPNQISPNATYLRWFFPDAGFEAKKYPYTAVCMLIKTDLAYKYLQVQTKSLSRVN